MTGMTRQVRLHGLIALAVAAFCGRGVVSGSDESTTSVILVVGAAGEPGYATNFQRQAEAWSLTCERGGATCVRIGVAFPDAVEQRSDAASEQPSTSTRTKDEDEAEVRTDRDRLREALGRETIEGTAPLWLVLIGHGTFDGKEARFNLRGPDLSPDDLGEWLAPIERPVVVVNTSSGSAPFLNALSGTNRVIVCATRSGHELSFAHFGGFLAEALGDAQSDLDKDDQISLLEAFLTASARVREFYRMEGRMASEHAIIDDNGDGRGTPADWFRGVRAVKKAQEDATVDGGRAHQLHLVLSPAEQALPAEIRARRDALELEVAALRSRKAEFDEAEYYRKLETTLLELARLYVPETSTE